MLTQAEFSQKVRKGLGRPSIAVRQILGDALVNDFSSIWLRYEWIKDRRFWQWISVNPQIDFDDGEEWIRVFRYDT